MLARFDIRPGLTAGSPILDMSCALPRQGVYSPMVIRRALFLWAGACTRERAAFPPALAINCDSYVVC